MDDAQYATPRYRPAFKDFKPPERLPHQTRQTPLSSAEDKMPIEPLQDNVDDSEPTPIPATEIDTEATFKVPPPPLDKTPQKLLNASVDTELLKTLKIYGRMSRKEILAKFALVYEMDTEQERMVDRAMHRAKQNGVITHHDDGTRELNYPDTCDAEVKSGPSGITVEFELESGKTLVFCVKSGEADIAGVKYTAEELASVYTMITKLLHLLQL